MEPDSLSPLENYFLNILWFGLVDSFERVRLHSICALRGFLFFLRLSFVFATEGKDRCQSGTMIRYNFLWVVVVQLPLHFWAFLSDMVIYFLQTTSIMYHVQSLSFYLQHNDGRQNPDGQRTR